MMRNTERLCFLLERLVLCSAFLVASNTSVVIQGEMIGTWFGGIPLMKFIDNIICVREIGGSAHWYSLSVPS